VREGNEALDTLISQLVCLRREKKKEREREKKKEWKCVSKRK